ncbi:MAG: hypothetical protein ACJ8AW_00430 [Rhodopila sp.]
MSSGRYTIAMGFTLEKLAQAMRGMPREAPILIRLPDGRLAEITWVKPEFIGGDGATHSGPSGDGTYAITLVVEKS